MRVLAKRRNALEAGPLVQSDRLGLSRSRFQHQTDNPQGASFLFQRAQ